MLGLSGKLLEAARSHNDLRRGRETQQLDLGYRSSVLSLDERTREASHDAGLRAGDRAPDAPCVGAGGQPVRLFTLLNSGGWTMLRYEAHGGAAIPAKRGLRVIDIGPGRELRDDAGHLRTAYGFQPGEIALIRPDGYIAALTRNEHGPGMANYLPLI
jgi:hypothetical protein